MSEKDKKGLLVEIDSIITCYRAWLDRYYKSDIGSQVSDATLMESLDFVSRNMPDDHNKRILVIKKSYVAMVDCLQSIGNIILEIENEYK